MATEAQLYICHRIMDLCAKLSAQKVGIFSCAYTGIADAFSVHAYEIQGYEEEELTYLDGWTSTHDGNTLYLGDWYGTEGECIDRLCSLEAKLSALMITDEDGIPV